MSSLSPVIAADPAVIDGPEIALNLGFTCLSVPATRGDAGAVRADAPEAEVAALLTAGELAIVSGQGRPARLAAGKPALREGDVVRAALLVRSGSLRMFRKTAEGRQHSVGDIPAGSLTLGAQLLGGVRARVTLVALADCELIVLEKHAVESAVARFPRLRRLVSAG